MTTVQQNSLKPGAHWRIVGMASAVNEKAIENCRAWLEAQGFSVSYGTHLFERAYDALHLAGLDHHRAADLMAALEDPTVDVVLAARGGYGAMRMLPHLDVERIRKLAPKPLVGFSDLTAVHHLLAKAGWASIHGPMAHSQWTGPSGTSLLRLLSGDAEDITTRPLEVLANPIREPLIAPWHGGNLALVAALVGTPYQPAWDGAVLYLEEVHEKPYRIDRMLQQLSLAGVLSRVHGLVFGEALFEGQSQEEAVRELVRDVAEAAGIPAWWGLKSGHSDPMIAVPFGRPLAIDPAGGVHLVCGLDD